MSGRVPFEGRVSWSTVIGAAMAMMALPETAFAQSDAGRPPPPSLNRSGRAPAVPTTTGRRPADLLDIRDRVEGAGTTVQVTPASASTGSILCVAGCDGTITAVVYAPMPKPTTFLAAMGPLEAAAPQPVKTAAVAPVAVPIAPAAAATASNVIVCVAGCYDNDRRTLLATGGPLPTPAVPFRGMLAAAAPVEVIKLAAAAPTVSAPAPMAARATAAVKLKRSIAAHAVRRDTRSKIAARNQKVAQKSAPKQIIAALGVPAPAAPAVPVAPKTPSAKVQPAVAHKKPVVVNTSNDWFNKITREQAAKKAAEPPKDD